MAGVSLIPEEKRLVRDFSELELDSELLQAIEEVGYDRPTVVQAQAIPHALDGRDILASAPTGTGKTAAFLLPMLQHLQDFPRKKNRGLRAYWC